MSGTTKRREKRRGRKARGKGCGAAPTEERHSESRGAGCSRLGRSSMAGSLTGCLPACLLSFTGVSIRNREEREERGR